jgi:ubiquinone/menaquinone biosynthesis C-methylase UbiE
MREQTVRQYRCPYTHEPLRLDHVTNAEGSEIVAGLLKTESGRTYEVSDGIPHLIDYAEETLTAEEKREAEYYEATAASYDQVIDWLFQNFYADEDNVREKMISLLEVKPDSRVLETGCGTCRDSIRIAAQLPRGELYLQDLSPGMLRVGRSRMQAASGSCQLEFAVGNACRLPFADGFFDAAYHFGGLNLFSDKRAALTEMARVVRVGGKVVVGDEGLAPWLRDTELGRILLNSNHLYTYEPPMDLLPENATDPCLRWVIGNAFYVVEFRVGSGAPAVDLDLPILGARGGTHRTVLWKT